MPHKISGMGKGMRKTRCKSKSKLLDLPRELLGLLYDKLEISDRVRFNIALPKRLHISNTMCTTVENDEKLTVIHRFFQRRVRAPVTRGDMSYAMRRFFHDNNDDPTVVRVIKEFPQLSQLSRKTSTEPATLVRQGQLETCVWADVEEEDVLLVQAMKERGTPAMFDSLMASDNGIRRCVLQNPYLFCFGIVNYRNRCGLLSHILQLGVNNPCNFPVESMKADLSSRRTLDIFLETPDKLKVIVDVVGVTSHVMDDLVEDAASKLLMPSLTYLLQAGATL